MKIIPLHSIVIVFGPCEIGKQKIFDQFSEHELLSEKSIHHDLVGTEDRNDISQIVFSELIRRTALKLRLGQRVIIDISFLPKNNRIQLATTASSLGVPVFYLIASSILNNSEEEAKFKSLEYDIMRGDGFAETIDGRIHEIEPILPLSLNNPISTLRKKWLGITAIGDIHGMYQTMLSAVAWARSRRHFVVFMGDVLDYGPGSLEVSDEVYRMVMRGEAEFIIGNHERKIMRWIDGHRVRLSDGNKVTTTALTALGDSARTRWIGRFRGLYQNGYLVRKMDSVSFAHAATHPAIWSNELMNRDIEQHALYGEIDETKTRPDRLVKSYQWCDAIPAEQTVVVGHDIRSFSHPLQITNENGGKTIFLDTGSGKGGQLSSADFRFTDSGLRLENFNVH